MFSVFVFLTGCAQLVDKFLDDFPFENKGSDRGPNLRRSVSSNRFSVNEKNWRDGAKLSARSTFFRQEISDF